MIAFCASQPARAHINAGQPGGFDAFSDAGDCFFVEADIGHDSAEADVFTGEFELWFDENQESRTRFCTGNSRLKNFANGDEGYVGDDEVDLLGYICGL